MSSTSAENVFGWYSKKQQKMLMDSTMKRNGLYQVGFWYKRKDSSELVLVTMVTNEMNHGTCFDDIEFKGKLGNFARAAWEYY